MVRGPRRSAAESGVMMAVERLSTAEIASFRPSKSAAKLSTDMSCEEVCVREPNHQATRTRGTWIKVYIYIYNLRCFIARCGSWAGGGGGDNIYIYVNTDTHEKKTHNGSWWFHMGSKKSLGASRVDRSDCCQALAPERGPLSPSAPHIYFPPDA